MELLWLRLSVSGSFYHVNRFTFKLSNISLTFNWKAFTKAFMKAFLKLWTLESFTLIKKTLKKPSTLLKWSSPALVAIEQRFLRQSSLHLNKSFCSIISANRNHRTHSSWGGKHKNEWKYLCCNVYNMLRKTTACSFPFILLFGKNTINTH